MATAQRITARWIPSTDENLHAFLRERADGFGQPERLVIFGERLNALGLFNKGGELTAVMLLYAARIRGRASLSTPPFSPWSGPYLHLKRSHPASRMSELKEVLEAFAKALKETKKPIVNVAMAPEVLDMQPFIWNGFEASPKYSYRLDLQKSEEALFSAIVSKRRNIIRQGAHLQLEEVKEISTLRPLVEDHLRGLNALHEPEVLERLIEGNPGSALKGLQIMDGATPVHWLVFLVDDSRVYYLFGGPHSSEGKLAYAGSVALWEAIKYFKKEGLEVFDFEGSMIPEVEHVFRSFGGEMISYFTLHLKDRLNKVVDIIR